VSIRRFLKGCIKQDVNGLDEEVNNSQAAICLKIMDKNIS